MTSFVDRQGRALGFTRTFMAFALGSHGVPPDYSSVGDALAQDATAPAPAATADKFDPTNPISVLENASRALPLDHAPPSSE